MQELLWQGVCPTPHNLASDLILGPLMLPCRCQEEPQDPPHIIPTQPHIIQAIPSKERVIPNREGIPSKEGGIPSKEGDIPKLEVGIPSKEVIPKPAVVTLSQVEQLLLKGDPHKQEGIPRQVGVTLREAQPSLRGVTPGAPLLPPQGATLREEPSPRQGPTRTPSLPQSPQHRPWQG